MNYQPNDDARTLALDDSSVITDLGGVTHSNSFWKLARVHQLLINRSRTVVPANDFGAANDGNNYLTV